MVRIHPSLILAVAAFCGCASATAAPHEMRGQGVPADYRGQPPRAPGPPPPHNPRRPDAREARYAPPPFADIGYATWREDEPEYRLYPGDQLDVTVLSAPELNRSVTVQPDGRITLPLIPPTMVADRSAPQVEAMLAEAYATQLVRPLVSVQIKQATSLKVFVGGEVDKPGVYDMPGDINALQAVIMAGGLKTSARSRQVVILRRGPAGEPMMRTLDLKAVTRDPYRDAVPLRRFDVVFEPRSTIAEVSLFFSQIRDALPFQFSYVINGQYVSSR
jgi:polysaccharide export outer membrane protein